MLGNMDERKGFPGTRHPGNDEVRIHPVVEGGKGDQFAALIDVGDRRRVGALHAPIEEQQLGKLGGGYVPGPLDPFVLRERRIKAERQHLEGEGTAEGRLWGKAELHAPCPSLHLLHAPRERLCLPPQHDLDPTPEKLRVGGGGLVQ
jgi:hypothetical protein